jgi:hypothetical protein
MKALKSSLAKTLLADPKAREQLRRYLTNKGTDFGSPRLLVASFVTEPDAKPVNITVELVPRGSK